MRWEDHLLDLTPVELRDGVLFKREDRFAPLGYGGINGAKLRQLVWLLSREQAAAGVVTGCSVLSPQAPMTALVGAHFGLPVTLVLGATSWESAVRHENIAIAVAAGAELRFAPVAYNPALQGAVARLHESMPDWYRLAYAITPPDDAEAEDIEAFHAVGARQVFNLPPDARTIVMTAGSCNSCVSVIYGLAQYRPPGLERLVLVEVGPGRRDWLWDRLTAITAVSGIDVAGYYTHDVEVEWLSVRRESYGRYQDSQPWAHGGIEFHPTYEGKMMRYLTSRGFDFTDALVWIVGSRPTRAAMRRALAGTGRDDGSAAALPDR